MNVDILLDINGLYMFPLLHDRRPKNELLLKKVFYCKPRIFRILLYYLSPEDDLWHMRIHLD